MQTRQKKFLSGQTLHILKRETKLKKKQKQTFGDGVHKNEENLSCNDFYRLRNKNCTLQIKLNDKKCLRRDENKTKRTVQQCNRSSNATKIYKHIFFK